MVGLCFLLQVSSPIAHQWKYNKKQSKQQKFVSRMQKPTVERGSRCNTMQSTVSSFLTRNRYQQVWVLSTHHDDVACNRFWFISMRWLRNARFFSCSSSCGSNLFGNSPHPRCKFFGTTNGGSPSLIVTFRLDPVFMASFLIYVFRALPLMVLGIFWSKWSHTCLQKWNKTCVGSRMQKVLQHCRNVFFIYIF